MCWASVLLDHSLCLHMAWVSYRTAVLENMHLEHGGWPLRAWKQKLPGQLRATPGPGWACLPSLHSIGQAFHPCVLLVKLFIPMSYWSNFSSLCPIGQTFHPHVLLVKAVTGSAQIQGGGAMDCTAWWGLPRSLKRTTWDGR